MKLRSVTRICKNVSVAVVCLVLSLWVMMAGLFPAVFPVFVQADTETMYEQTNVLDDLKHSTIDGKSFSLTEYGFDDSKETKVLSLVEYCYSFYEDKQGCFGLYLYIYNPKSLEIEVDSNLNTVSLSYGEGADASYAKYPLVFLNCSMERHYEGLFYKFKIALSPSQKQALLETVDSQERVYRVSGLELLERGEQNATDFAVATAYHYKGYAAGYGSDLNASNTLACECEEIKVLTLKVQPTVYRPKGTNGKNEYTQDSLHSVYFAVPNEIVENNGTMRAVHARWLDAVLAPALVTGNKQAYDAIYPLLGKRIEDEETFSYMYLGAYSWMKNGESGSIYRCGYSYYNSAPLSINDGIWSGYAYGKNVERLYATYFSGESVDSADGYTVPSEDILADLKASKAKYGGDLVNGKYSRNMFESVAQEWTEVNIQADKTFSLTDEKIDRNWWEKLWGLSGTVTTNTFDGISAIYEVKESDVQGSAEEVCQRLYIDEADYTNFYTYYQNNKERCTVYLFRYQVSDYIAQEATLLEENTGIFGNSFTVVDTNAYFFQETVNLDFDIIDITYANGKTQTVIPVVCSPIDVIPDAKPPVYTQTDQGTDWLKWVKNLVVLLFIAVIFFVCLPLLLLLAKGIVWLITKGQKEKGQAVKRRKESQGGKDSDNDENG